MTTTEFQKIADIQLTSEELILLRLSLTMSIADIAIKLGWTRQGVSGKLARATKKIEEQKKL